MSEAITVADIETEAERLRAVAAGVDAALLTLHDCERALRAVSAIEAMAATVKALLAARLAAASAHKATHDVSAEAMVARLTGSTPTQAREQIATGQRLEALEETAALARRGALSFAQTQAIAGAAAADPGAEGALLEAAPTTTLGQLREECARVKAAADPDPAATHRRLRQGRAGRRYGTPDGFQHLHVQSTADDLAEIDVTLHPIVDELFKAARGEGRRERREAYVADALVEMARRARGVSSGTRKTPPTYTAVIRVDHAALVRGAVGDGEVCEIAGLGPVPVSVARELLGEATLKLVLTKGVEVRNVTSLGRGPTAAMKVAAAWEQPTCRAGCGRRARLEADHTFGREYATTRHTRYDELDWLCDPHHDKKTNEGWALVAGTGIRPMVPPDDPRHPANAAKRRRGPPERGP